MNEPRQDDPSQLEELLRDVSFASPTPRLDRRVDALLAPRRAGWIGPLVGFAAGVAVTVCILPALLRSRAVPDRLAAAPADLNPPARGDWAEPRAEVETIYGEIDGTRVRLQHTRDELELSPDDPGADADPDQLMLVERTTIEPVEAY